MHNRILAGPKGYQLATHKIISLCLSLSIVLTSASAFAPQAQSQVPVGLGISLGSMLVSGMASGRRNKRVNVQNRAIDECNRGTKLIEHGDYEGAVEAYHNALAIDPTLLDAHWNSAVAFKKLEDYEHCLAEAKIVLDKRPTDGDAIFMAAAASQQLHQFTQAEQYYKDFLALHKSGEQAQFAERSVSLLDHVFLSAPEGDYLADATTTGQVHWNKMPLKVFINEELSLSGYIPEYTTTLKQAFMDWSAISDGKVSFTFTDRVSDAQIICGWSSGRLQIGSSEELGLTHTEREENTIVAAKISLYTLADRPKATKEELLAAAKQVDLHEIGHALGLGHSKQPYDIMYFETAPDGLEFPLTVRDRNTILAIYGENKPSSQIAQLPANFNKPIAQISQRPSYNTPSSQISGMTTDTKPSSQISELPGNSGYYSHHYPSHYSSHYSDSGSDRSSR